MHFLYDFIIQPLVLVYDIIYTILYRMIGHPVFAILALSIIINLLALPLYRKADLLQRDEIDKQEKMKPWLDHIRKHFSGDERFMMTQAYYKVQHYNQLSILKEAGPLALQIPFFMAAYNYISNIPLLETSSFGPITNLLKPDALIIIGGFSINILPIIMTAINWISGYIYTKGGAVRQKVQVYGVSAIFLVLLYNSPSGLVIYWIMNQLFSLGKNIVFTRGIGEKTRRTIISVISVVILFFLEFQMVYGNINSGIEFIVALCIVIACIINLFTTAFRMKNVRTPEFMIRIRDFLYSFERKGIIIRVILVEVCLAALLGFYIPSSVLSASTADFVDASTGAFPFELLTYPATVYSGLLILWMTVIIFSRSEKKQWSIGLFLWLFLGVAVVNQFFFDPKVGNLYVNLLFDGKISAKISRTIVNILTCAIVCIAFLIVFIKKPHWMKNISAVLAIVLIGMGTYNIVQIQSDLKSIKTNNEMDNSSEKILALSKNGKNVVVVMLDRAIGTYVPYIFDEKPDLNIIFDGFVYYPNTVSFGMHTKYGSPGLFGGYEYNPLEMNKRNEETNVAKHDEALSVMPVMFWKENYNVTVADIPFGEYAWGSDLSFLDKYQGIKTMHLSSQFSAVFEQQLKGSTVFQKRNFVLYGLFRSVPLALKPAIYDNGYYISLKNSRSYSTGFINNYSELDALKIITDAKNDDKNYFFVMDNDIAHNPTILSPPDYSINKNYINSIYEYADKELDGRTLTIDSDSEWGHYCANMVMYKLLGEWLDSLKEKGIYDNTRIIFVADHGYFLGQFSDLLHPEGLDIEGVNPLLMVKDFNAHGIMTTDDTFMTNADVPSIATKDLIENPINPFSGNPLEGTHNKEEGVYVCDNRFFSLSDKTKTTFDFYGDHWWKINDNVFDMNNWEMIDGDKE